MARGDGTNSVQIVAPTISIPGKQQVDIIDSPSPDKQGCSQQTQPQLQLLMKMTSVRFRDWRDPALVVKKTHQASCFDPYISFVVQAVKRQIAFHRPKFYEQRFSVESICLEYMAHVHNSTP